MTTLSFEEMAPAFDVIHLATHGLLDDGAPLCSSLLLAAAPEDGEDGLLEVHEIAALRLKGPLVVLSACETGRGSVRPGRGLMGMSWALLAAGASTAIVADWKTDSAATAALMVGLHRRLLAGDSPARALRAASLALRRNPRYSHPYYWAPFAAVGRAW